MAPLTDDVSVLIVEDNEADIYLLQEMLRSSPFCCREIYTANSVRTACQLLKKHKISLVLLDLSLPDSFGISTFVKISKLTRNIPVLILTGGGDGQLALDALHKGAQDYLIKGEFTQTLLVKAIQYSIERKKAEEHIHASEEKYKQVFYKNPFPMWIYDAETLRILEVNEAAIQKYGYDHGQFLQLTMADIIAPSVSSEDARMSAQLQRHLKRSGDTMFVEYVQYPINYYGRTAVQAQVNDVTDRLKLEQELAVRKQQTIEAVLNAQEEERSKLGQELHDNINQILATVQLTLEVALRDLPRSEALVDKSRQNTSMAIQEIRKLCKGLILPVHLKEMGLAPSVELLLSEISNVTNMTIVFEAAALEEDLMTEDQKVTVYRIVQEQLNNILKYAQATAVTVNLQCDNGQINLIVADNGKGFNTRMKRKGIGIANIYSRAELFNGEVTLDSSPGNGCRLSVRLGQKAEAREATANGAHSKSIIA